MLASHPPATWLTFCGIIALLLVVELGAVSRVPNLSMRQATWWSVTVIAVAALFGALLWKLEGRGPALQFATGYIVEFSLSVDNLLVFIMVLHYFAVPAALQPTALKWGILGAIAMRAVMIGGGTLLLAELHWVIYLLGALLVVTGIRMLIQRSDVPVRIEQNPLLRLARRAIPVSDTFEGAAFVIRRAGRLVATPLLLVVLVIEWTDLMFATDSIPAIFAITRDPFLIFSSNILAIIGLRALFFALAATMARFAYLRAGVALVLMLVGTKMAVAHWFTPPTGWSLAVIAVVLGVSVGASLLRELKTR